MLEINLKRIPLAWLRLLDILIVFGSVLLCCILLLLRLPGLELLGIAPDWMLIWVVVWSVKRTVWQGAIAGIVLGLIQDGLTSPHPSHVLSLALVGVLTASLGKQRYTQEDFITIAPLVFVMVFVTETIMAIQFSLTFTNPLEQIRQYYQQSILASAIISSIWTPVLYYPLNIWWTNLRKAIELRTK
ncbi:MAG: rod shape-determining protein MreD [Xenococcaceae cyanobacterium]